jgi:hypothetical protein
MFRPDLDEQDPEKHKTYLWVASSAEFRELPRNSP